MGRQEHTAGLLAVAFGQHLGWLFTTYTLRERLYTGKNACHRALARQLRTATSVTAPPKQQIRSKPSNHALTALTHWDSFH
ncbi:hypothetical protein [Adhaeretor mobilis]|uniref:hypothetical protein n=1 Tax=Adhaeretor mobilis TaxID=1930276 RepID=UPI001C54E213|nr:hypothetical protein [Adhaeretor mobilis]